jgi:hypothetical protein
VWSRRRELLELMVDERPPDAGTRAHLTCLARDLNIAEIVEYLSPDAPPDCVADAAIRAVRERSIPR